MRSFKTLKLGTVCTDKPTELTGTLTHWTVDLGGKIDYFFQPRGLNPETGQPVAKIFVEIERLEGYSDKDFEVVGLPFDILGSIVEDMASGFRGSAVAFIMHINGCCHVAIQPPGVLPKTNSAIGRREFDLRECMGEKIQELSPTALAESRVRTPSPSPTDDDVPFCGRESLVDGR